MKSKYAAALSLALALFGALPLGAVHSLDCGTAKKEISLSQVASRDLLLQAQKELNIR